ncbi:MAG: hypothetical protein ACREHG_03925, partial [Candidatus Saccharimonadales bacterium]
LGVRGAGFLWCIFDRLWRYGPNLSEAFVPFSLYSKASIINASYVRAFGFGAKFLRTGLISPHKSRPVFSRRSYNF